MKKKRPQENKLTLDVRTIKNQMNKFLHLRTELLELTHKNELAMLDLERKIRHLPNREEVNILTDTVKYLKDKSAKVLTKSDLNFLDNELNVTRMQIHDLGKVVDKILLEIDTLAKKEELKELNSRLNINQILSDAKGVFVSREEYQRVVDELLNMLTEMHTRMGGLNRKNYVTRHEFEFVMKDVVDIQNRIQKMLVQHVPEVQQPKLKKKTIKKLSKEFLKIQKNLGSINKELQEAK